ATPHIGQGDDHLTVETARTQQRRVEDVRTVGGGDDQHALPRFEAVHLYQQLVKCLFAFVVTAAQACATLTTHGVDFVDEDNAGSLLLGVLEHVAHARSTDAHEHFNEVGTRNAEERHLGFTGDGLGQQSLTRSGRPHQQDATRNSPAQSLELGGSAEEVHEFLHVFLGFVAPGDVGKGNVIRVFVEHAGARLPQAEGAALTAPLHLAHEEDPYADQKKHREPGNEQ